MPATHQAPRLSYEQRVALGKAARKAAPRSSHARYEPRADRPDPIALLEQQASTRVPELVPIRYGRMLSSPFAFFRGAALVMASDLAHTPRSGLSVQCCGDAHVSNFGVFASPERTLVFDVNDFDETLPGPWEWDLKRLAASLAIAARENGFARSEQLRIVCDAAAQYRAAMRELAAMSELDVWYARVAIEATLERYAEQIEPRALRRSARTLAKARTRDSLQAFAKLAREVDGEVRIVSDPPLIVPVAELADGVERDELLVWLRELVELYAATLEHDRRVLLERFELTDFAQKVVGVGSVGTRAWIALLIGAGREPLFLQIKEAQPSVLERFAAPSEFSNHGQRVVAGQRLMQAASDIFLGWLRVPAGEQEPARDFYCRQLRDWKGSAELERMRPDGMAAYGRLCAWTLARGHARSGDRVAIAAYVGSGDVLDRAIVQFADDYAEQNERDHAALAAAVKQGRVPARTGV